MLKYLARYKGRRTIIYAPYADAAKEKALAYFHLPEENQDRIVVELAERYVPRERKEGYQ